jgi:glucokinase
MYLLFDIGGTHMRVGVTRDGHMLGKYEIVDTPRDFLAAMHTLQQIAQRLNPDGKFKAAAGGIAGPLDPEHQMLVQAPHLPGWSGKPIHNYLSQFVEQDVFLENDTAVVGLGEATYGAGQGSHVMAYVTVSTGVGGARIVNQHIDESHYSFEPGHQIVNYRLDSNLSTLTQLEDLISGSGIEKRLRQKAEEITDRKFWDEICQYLAVGLYNTLIHWSPDTLVLGGGMINSGIIDVELVKKYLGEITQIYPTLPEIKPAKLKDVGGLYGALELLRYKLAEKETK